MNYSTWHPATNKIYVVPVPLPLITCKTESDRNLFMMCYVIASADTQIEWPMKQIQKNSKTTKEKLKVDNNNRFSFSFYG